MHIALGAIKTYMYALKYIRIKRPDILKWKFVQAATNWGGKNLLVVGFKPFLQLAWFYSKY